MIGCWQLKSYLIKTVSIIIFIIKIDDEKYIKSIQTASEWIMKENCVLYRGNICGIFEEKNDLSYIVYKKLISLSPQYLYILFFLEII